jgi:hypothetical protein
MGLTRQRYPSSEVDRNDLCGSTPALGHSMRTIFIHHDDSTLDRDVIALWIASFSDLAGLVIIQEPRGNRIGRVRRELRRDGLLGFADVLAFRAYYSLRLPGRIATGRKTPRETRPRLAGRPLLHPEICDDDPNNRATRRFIDDQEPDLMIARCRVLLASEIFSIPPLRTFVMHPVTTPEYRNSHGCFWAQSNRDL